MSGLPSAAEIERLLPLATAEEATQLKLLLELQLSLDSPLAYALRVTPTTQPFPHIVLLDQYLVALINHALYPEGSQADLLRPDLPAGIGDPAAFVEFDNPDPGEEGSGRFIHPETGEECVYNLAISMPPQHGKSYMVSEHLIAWYLTKYPSRQAAIVSYEETFATSWAYKVRQKIDSHPEYGIDLDPSTKAKGEWLIKRFTGADGAESGGGGLMAAGVGGPLTGRSIHLLVMDDLIKNAEEALSETKIKGTHDWWHTTAKTRNQSPRQFPGQAPEAGVRVLMHTRWSKNDLIGYTQRTEPGEWFYLNLPALSEGTDPDRLPQGHRPDPLGRKEGLALAPLLHSKAVLLQTRDSGDPDDPASGGSFWFEAMYQGYPTLEGKGLFPTPYHYFTRKGPKFIFEDGYVCFYDDFRHFTSVDLAISTKQSADFSVFMELGQSPEGRLAVIDVHRERLEAPDHEDKLRAWLKTKARMVFIAIEDKTYGSALIQSVRRKGGFVARPMPADKDKVTRAIPAGQAVMNEQIWWPKPNEAKWVPAFESELSEFPAAGTHDDMVDALAHGVQAWLTMPRSEKTPDRDEEASAAKARRNKDRILKRAARKKGRPKHPMLGRM
jgi:predicted phage terminase large subunit-like protein